ncbi:MAG: hypothetical protein ABSG61_07865 [Gemmatimonadales bacterium]|jgi:hypothetical protein
MTRAIRCVGGALLALAATAAGPQALRAQAFRLHWTTTAEYVQLRPIEYDSASGAYEALPVAYAAPVTQDVEVSAWGLGVEGLRGYALMRGRAALGSELVWPRYGDHFDLLAAYLELQRQTWRLRLGRQQRASALGWYAFDGLTAGWQPVSALRIEGYGGRGLARATLQPYNSPALLALDPLHPDQGTILLGAALSATPFARSSFSAIYQREVLSDRSGLVSERAAVDGRVGIGSFLTLSGSADADLAEQWIGKASVSAAVRLSRSTFISLEAFRYRPTLDLTTIWGAFVPESNNGYTASLQLAAASDLSFSGAFTYRRWQPLSAGSPFLVDVPDNQKEVTLGAHARRGALALDGSYHLELGYGGDQSGGDVSVAWAPQDGWRAGLSGTAFKQTDMVRVTGGTVFGVGANIRTPLGHRLGLSADVTRYFQRRLAGTTGVDWNQTRASLTFDWTMGADADRTGGYR